MSEIKLLIGFCFLVITIFSLGYFIDNHNCYSISSKMNKSYYFSFSSGCMIEYEKEKWIPLNNYRVTK